MFFAKFANLRNFYIFWGVIAALLVLVWARFLAEPKRTAGAVGMTRLAGLRALLMLSIGWYLVWAGVHVLNYFLSRT